MTYKKNNSFVASVRDVDVRERRELRVTIKEQDYLDEILFFILLSVVGEHWDRQGLMRIHGASFCVGGKNGVVIAGPSKSGKSTLSTKILSHTDFAIFSDELTLLDLRTKELLPCPIRIGGEAFENEEAQGLSFFRQKKLIPIAAHRVAPVAKLTRFIRLEPARDAKASPKILPMNLKTRIKMVWEIFFGLGLIQMWEYLLRPTLSMGLLQIAWNRLRLILWILLQPSFRFVRGSNSDENLRTLRESQG